MEGYNEYVTSVSVVVTAPSEEEANAALARSGFASGNLIGEVLIEEVERVEEL